MGIIEAYLVILLANHFEHFLLLKNLKKLILLQTIVNMCETHNNMTFTTAEQKIAWEYLEAYLRNIDFG